MQNFKDKQPSECNHWYCNTFFKFFLCFLKHVFKEINLPVILSFPLSFVLKFLIPRYGLSVCQLNLFSFKQK